MARERWLEVSSIGELSALLGGLMCSTVASFVSRTVDSGVRNLQEPGVASGAGGTGVLANVEGASGCNLVGPMAGTSDKVFGHRN